MKNLKLAALCFGGVLISACAPSYKENFDEDCKKVGYTKDQCDAAREDSYRFVAGKEISDGKYEVDYTRLPMEDVIRNVRQQVLDLKDWLDYKNTELQQYAKAFGLRPWFEQQEKIFKTIFAQLTAADLYRKFQREIGNVSNYYNYADPSRDGYDPSIFKVTDFQKAYPFTAKALEDAKLNGLVQLIGTRVVSQFRRLDHKEPDLAFPNDPNKFVWQSRRYSLEIMEYKIMPEAEAPKDSAGNYLEAFRVKDGKYESLPALRCFLDGKSGTALVLIDDDQEGKDIGFGLPDALERMPESAILGPEMFDRLFPVDDSYRRVEPKLPPVRVEIARAGQPIDVWEKSTDAKGFMAPTGYQIAPLNDNYNVRILREKMKKEENYVHGGGFKVEYVVKEYTGGDRYKASLRNVWEYYTPKSPYGDKVLKADVQYSESSRDATRKLQFVFPDGTEDSKIVTPGSNKVIGDRPKMVAFDAGEVRWLLKDEDGDGVYEKRRQIGKLQIGTGEYQQFDSLGEGNREGEHNHDNEVFVPVPATPKAN